MLSRVFSAVALAALTSSLWAADNEETEKKEPVKQAKARAVVAVQAANLKEAVEAQRVATKKLAEARESLKQWQEKVANANKEIEAATDEAAKRSAVEKLADAKIKLGEAEKEVAERTAELKKLAQAGNAVAIRMAYSGGQPIAVRENVDPQDPIERFAVLTPGGPIVVEAALTVDGKPFRVLRENLIDEMVAAADTDGDGKTTWDEALKSTGFTLNRIRITNDQQRQSYLSTLDKNKDGLVDRSEVRLFIAMYFRAPAFSLVATNYPYRSITRVVLVNGQRVIQRGGNADVKSLLDANNDGSLSEDEIAQAGQLLKDRDADDNDLLYPHEISSGTGTNNRVQVFRRSQSAQQLAVLLGPTADADALFQILEQRYKAKDEAVTRKSFTAVPELFATLDRNGDGKLQKDEVLALNDVKPHIELTVDLGQEGAKGINLQSISPELHKSDATGQSVAIELPGFKVNFAANMNPPRTFDYSQTAKSYLSRYDKDNNGYLDKKELGGNLSRMMEMWDGDNDGKVFPEEIVASYTRMQAPQQSQLRANVANQGNSLFQALDQTGDGRLSLREMRTAHERLKTFDKNQDNQISADEIPETLSVTFSLGNAVYNYGMVTPGQSGQNAGGKNAGPEWFTRMDRNGDGDVTLKEFLGEKEDFERLDTNNDGFIEAKEAFAASQQDTESDEK